MFAENKWEKNRSFISLHASILYTAPSPLFLGFSLLPPRLSPHGLSLPFTTPIRSLRDKVTGQVNAVLDSLVPKAY